MAGLGDRKPIEIAIGGDFTTRTTVAVPAMSRTQSILRLLQARVKRVLDLAELAVPGDKFERFRTLVLDEFGHKGFQDDLDALMAQGDAKGAERQDLGKLGAARAGEDRHGMGRTDSGKEGGVP